MAAPKFTVKPSIRQEKDGNTLVFSCQVEASPRPEITWFRGDSRLSDSDRVHMKIGDAGGDRYNIDLEILHVSQNDAGSYKVVARNDRGEVSASINLNFAAGGGGQRQEGVAPSFTQKPTIRQADGGKKLIFECLLTAQPQPEIKWFKGETQLASGGRYLIFTDSVGPNQFKCALEVTGVGADDQGSYKVTARNALGEGNATINLNFQGMAAPKGSAPKFTSKPSIRQEPGNKILFECRLTADPAPQVTWYKSGSVITSGGRYQLSMEQQGAEYVLRCQISEIAASDGGDYKVTAKNSFGESNANIALNFEGAGAGQKKESSLSHWPAGGKPPSFKSKPSIRQEKNALIMSCSVEAQPAPQITWSKDGDAIAESGRIAISQQAQGADTFLLTLQIMDPQLTDGGQYKCHARNELGEGNANIALNLQGGKAPPKPQGVAPQFKEKPNVRQDQSGKNIIMESRCTATPKPTVMWYHGNTGIKDGGRYKISMKQDGEVWVLTLVISNFTIDDGGAYKIAAKNDLGEGTANINLNMEQMMPKEPAPKIDGKPVIRLEDGKRIIMEIKVLAKSKPSCVWTFGSNQLQDGGRYFIDIAREGDCFIMILEIDDVSNKDSGAYKSVIKTAGGEAIANIAVNLEEMQRAAAPPAPAKPEGEEPVFVQKLAPKTVNDGDPLELSAKVKGTPPIDIAWFKNNKIIKPSDDFKQTFVNGLARLSIPEVFPEDTGKYSVEAANDFGEAICHADIVVKEVPGLMQKPKEEEKVEPKKTAPAEAAPKPVEEKVAPKKDEPKQAAPKMPEEKPKPKPEEKPKPKPEEKIEPKKVEPKQAEPKKPEEKKVEPKKPEEKKKPEEPKKIEPKKKEEKKEEEPDPKLGRFGLKPVKKKEPKKKKVPTATLR